MVARGSIATSCCGFISMASVGTWRAPMPFKVGGGGHKHVTQAYNKINANLGTALAHDWGTVNNIQTVAEARAIALIHRAADRRYNQADPNKTSTLLERWEAILGITPSTSDTEYDRRKRVSARLHRNHNATYQGLLDIVREAFEDGGSTSAWTVGYQNATHLDADEYLVWASTWPAATDAPVDPIVWASGACHLVIEYIRPTGFTDEEVDKKRAAALEALEEFAPVWCTFALSETQSTGTNANNFGFFLDQPNLDVACLGYDP